jgi:uncharacterized protein YkwD
MQPILRWSVIPLVLLAVAQGAPPAAPTITTAAPAKDAKDVDWYAMSADDFFKRDEVKDRIKEKSANATLLEAAIFHETNRRRVAEKLSPFKHGYSLQLMARQHSEEMAKLQYFEHESPVAENRTLSDRLKKVGLVNVTAGENIAVLPAKEMGSGTYIVQENEDGSQTLIDAQTHKRISYYTYEEFAKAALDQWMHSPGHRANILNARFNYLGAGIGRGPYDGGQDSFYLTQNFSSTVGARDAAAADRLK